MTRKSLSALFLGIVLVAGCQQKGEAQGAAGSPAPMSDDEKAVYALGAAMGSQMAQQVKALNLSPAEQDLLKKAVAASLSGQTSEYTLQQYGPKLQARAQAQASAVAGAEKQKSAAFREAAAKEQGAVQTASGLIFRTLTPGNGASPKATDQVRVHYQGTLSDGTVFDSSLQRGQPLDFALNGVIPCWTEGVQRMKVGEKAKLVCPSEIAYGDQGRGPSIPGGATLVFEIELLAVNPAAKAGAGQ
jgi:FKBP-type peptidyl-prolyl cis-trans isomerase FkpA